MSTAAPRQSRAAKAKAADEQVDQLPTDDAAAAVEVPVETDEDSGTDETHEDEAPLVLEDDRQPIKAVGTEDTITLADGRTMTREEYDTRMRLLTRPFTAGQVEKLPKVLGKGDLDKGDCVRGSRYSADGIACGGYHARAIHLDYVGHAGITMRLLEVDPKWDYEFQHVDLPAWVERAVASCYERGDYEEARRLVRQHGAPVTRDGGYWITLTILGDTRKGFGDAANKTGPNAMKEAIGDALRNAAMRFGAGTYLWSKSGEANSMKQGVDVPALPDVRSIEAELQVATESPDPVSALTSIGMKYGEPVLQQVQYTRKSDGVTITAWAALTHLLGWAKDKIERAAVAQVQEVAVAQEATEQESQDPEDAPAAVVSTAPDEQARQAAAQQVEAAEVRANAPRDRMTAFLTGEVIGQADVLGLLPTKYTEGFLAARGVHHLHEVSPTTLRAWVLQQRPVIIDALEQQGRASEAATYRAAGNEVRAWMSLTGLALPAKAPIDQQEPVEAH